MLKEGQRQQALETYQKAATWFRHVGDDQKAGEIWFKIGSIYHKQRQYPEALEYYENALNIFRDIPNRKDEGMMLSYIGIVHFSLSRYEEALEFFRQALEIAQEEKDLCPDRRSRDNDKTNVLAYCYH